MPTNYKSEKKIACCFLGSKARECFKRTRISSLARGSMETKSIHEMKFLARRNLNLAILSWGVLSVIAVIGFLMERFPYRGDNDLIYLGLVVIAIVLVGNFMLHIRGAILSLTLARRNKKESKDPIVTRAAFVGAILGIAGAITSVFLFLGW
jgi:hypothetical protein